ncbi:MAG: hypothetical protein O2958_03735 [Gemmatimonadetes bacterium]|nr:hypothetical protein [Gemmatimonadota bacterium]MDA1102432.1 hypothetical protein [Gemmatimonadota bacterium]
MRIACSLIALAALTAPASAQDLQRPDGWLTRFDMANMSEADLEVFVDMPPGWHITSGPAGIYWTPSNSIAGDFRAEMEVFLFDPEGRREAFGMFLGGRQLDGAAQEYTYFLLRDGGQFIIKRREGAESPTIRPWTGNNSIRAYADRGQESSVKNVLAVEARTDEVRFFVNGTEVANVPRTEVNVDGIYGFRVNHALSLHISRLEVTPIR